jgi:hypothetical protein
MFLSRTLTEEDLRRKNKIFWGQLDISKYFFSNLSQWWIKFNISHQPKKDLRKNNFSRDPSPSEARLLLISSLRDSDLKYPKNMTHPNPSNFWWFHKTFLLKPNQLMNNWENINRVEFEWKWVDTKLFKKIKYFIQPRILQFLPMMF